MCNLQSSSLKHISLAIDCQPPQLTVRAMVSFYCVRIVCVLNLNWLMHVIRGRLFRVSSSSMKTSHPRGRSLQNRKALLQRHLYWDRLACPSKEKLCTRYCVRNCTVYNVCESRCVEYACACRYRFLIYPVLQLDIQNVLRTPRVCDSQMIIVIGLHLNLPISRVGGVLMTSLLYMTNKCYIGTSLILFFERSRKDHVYLRIGPLRIFVHDYSGDIYIVAWLVAATVD